MKKMENILLIFCWFYLLNQVNEVSSEVSAPSCHTTLTGSSGTFTSPNYPQHPDPPEEIIDSIPQTDQRGFVICQWEITVPPGKGIQLKFGHFSMNAPGHPDDCDKGEVDVSSGIGKEKSSLDKFCPGNRPDTVILLNNTATVVFRRPASFSGTGFLISYIAITSGEPIDDFVTCTDMVDIYSRVETFSVVCPSGCAGFESHKVFGMMPYRDENTHLCRAAVHAGVISDQLGGRVNVRRELGQPLYMKATANNITTSAGAMSDYKIDFPAVYICRERITLQRSQFTASSYVNATEANGKFYSWLPGNAHLSTLKTSWSPKLSSEPQWIQVDLGKIMNITGIITTGSQDPYSSVKLFSIKYSYNNITYFHYKEANHSLPKVFAGNHNFYSEVRNNFIQPTLVARHIRVYPVLLNRACEIRCGMKLGFTGCEVTKEVPTLPPQEPPRHIENKVSTTQSSTSETTTLKSVTSQSSTIAVNFTEAETTSTIAQAFSKTTNISVTDGEGNGGLDEQNPNNNGEVGKPSDLNERTIVIIAIVTGLGVTCLLLAALVLFLVRKRKKDPAQNTMIPKTNSRDNATYNGETGMNSIYRNNNASSKKSKKKSKQNIDFMNQNYRETMTSRNSGAGEPFLNERGGVTLRYGQQENGTTLPVRASYSPNSDGPGVSGLVGNILYDEKAGKFARNDDDHEYQVILDPVSGPNYAEGPSSSMSSTASGSRGSYGVKHPRWSENGDGLNRRSFGDQKKMSSFAPLDKSTSRPTRSGTFPHNVQNMVYDEELHPHNRSTSFQHHSSLTAPKSTKTNGVTLPPKLSSGLNPPNPNQHSSSSSSSHSLSSDSSPNLPEEENSHSYDPLFAQQHHGRKPSYNVPTNNRPIEAPLLSTFSANPPHPGVNGGPMFSNGSEIPRDPNSSQRLNARSESLNHARLRSGYDQLYKNKAPFASATIPKATISTSDYNQLNLQS